MSMSKQILIVDDDHEICELLSEFLKNYNFSVLIANDGEQMFAHLKNNTPDMIILDMMLPGDDGLTLCRKLREKWHIPILILSAVGEDTDRIVGLEVGADDYLSKPFNPRELLARIKAILRRSNHQPPSNVKPAGSFYYEFEHWKLSPDKHEFFNTDNELVILSSGEFSLLLILVTHPQKVLTRDQIMEITKDRDASPFDRSIDMQVSRLRQKIESNPRSPRLIKTIRGGGYKFTARVTKRYDEI